VVLASCGGLGVVVLCRGATGENAFDQTRRTLQQQGFKTDLADFNLSTSPELQAREAVLNATAPARNAPRFTDHPNLMEGAGNNSAIVVWEMGFLKKQTPSWPDNKNEMTWDEFREVLNQNQSQADAACAAILSGPIQFNLRAGDGNYMLLPHLAMLKNLTQVLADRSMLALHEGNLDAAYSNLMAATRLVTAWKVEPVEVSHRVCFENAKLAFAATWQALQTNGWTDTQLAQLQREWEGVDFFAGLPEVAAFKRASDVKEGDYEPPLQPRPRPSFGVFVEQALDNPLGLWSKLLYASRQQDYLQHGNADDKRDILLFYRDREIELRNAIQANSWAQMRGLPGVTNAPVFHSKYPTRAEMRRNTWEISRRIQERGKSMLGLAAETETERQLIVTALALERYRNRHGGYPKALAGLAPEFLKAAPLDFMDGRPLRYRGTDDGRFVLYSVGLDCLDDGGQFQPQKGNEDFENPFRPAARTAQADLVWPLAATTTDAQARRKQEQRVQAEKLAQIEERERADEARAETLRQAAVKNLLTRKPVKIKDPAFQGKPLSVFLQSQEGPATNKLSMAELLSARQVVTGEEPDIATFEVPMRYDVVKKIGELRLLVDAGGPEPTDAVWVASSPEVRAYDGGGELQEFSRATNGNCLLSWNTTYDPPGQHALQVELLCTGKGGDWHTLEVKGPVLPFYSSNVVQFFEGTSLFTDKGASLYAKIAEPHGVYTIELKSPAGEHIKTISGTTSNGVIDVFWDLHDEHGNKYTNDSLKAVYHVTLPRSGRSQNTEGP